MLQVSLHKESFFCTVTALTSYANYMFILGIFKSPNYLLLSFLFETV